jgi:hypothetical protein
LVEDLKFKESVRLRPAGESGESICSVLGHHPVSDIVIVAAACACAMVLVAYEIFYPCNASDESAHLAPSSGAAEMLPSEGPKLRMRDLKSQWPFEGRFHFRALFSPPSEPHVYLDFHDDNMPLPVCPDGVIQVRALPLDHLQGVPSAPPGGEVWAWGEEDLAAWRAQRAAAGEAYCGSGAGGAEGTGTPWGGVDGDFQEGGPSVGAPKGTLAEAAEDLGASAVAAAAAAREAAGKAAGAAMDAAKKIFSGMGWGSK